VLVRARWVWLAFTTIVVALLVAVRADALAVPKLEGRVSDYADVLSADAERRIGQMLEGHEKKTGQQFAVLTIDSLEGDPLEDFSIRTVEAWKLGDAKRDDGLLLVVVKSDRKVRIEVGHGLEGTITDAVSSRIIRGLMIPAFKAGDYARGIERALDALIRIETGQAAEIPDVPAARRSPQRIPSLVALLLFLVPLLIPLWFVGRRGGRFGRAGALGGWYGGYGGGFGGSSGGGFSGGGGSFGGGGASGSW